MLPLFAVLAATSASAHKASDSYLTLTAREAEVGVGWDIALKDLDVELDLDADGDGAIRWKEVQSREAELLKYALGHLTIAQGNATCVGGPSGMKLTRHSDGTYVVIDATVRCARPVTELTVGYSLLFDADAQHRGLVRLAGAESWVGFSTDVRSRTLTFTTLSRSAQTWEAFKEGVHHIAIGADHLCFLFALLLPSVLRRTGAKWESAPALKPAMLEILKVVTSFTLAHSITLGLAAFDVVRPEAKWVEVAIAASVALAAFNNLFPFLPEGRWSLAFGLGLLHGFGFVYAMQDLGSGGPGLWLSVLGFNLGVEAGQAAIVGVFVPIAFVLRSSRFYRLVLLQIGSVGILCAGVWWLAERI